MEPTISRSQHQISDYQGQEVIRTALTTSEYVQRISLIAVLMIFTLGFAFCYRSAQKLWSEVKEGNKITYLTPEEIEENEEIAKTDKVGQEKLVEKKDEKEQPPKNSANQAGKTLEPIKVPHAPKKQDPSPLNNEQTEIITPPTPTFQDPQVTFNQNNFTQKTQEVQNPLEEIKKLPPSIPQISSAERIVKQQLENFEFIKSQFSTVKSNLLHDAQGLMLREDFKQAVNEQRFIPAPVVIGISDIIPGLASEMVGHLMRRKQDSKLGRKYESGDQITNMEGALHTFVTPITPIVITGDYIYEGRHTIREFNGKGRTVVLSAAIHPDFERGGENEVVMKIVEIKEESIEGKKLYDGFIPLNTQMMVNAMGGPSFEQKLPQYEKDLQRHMVYHLTANHRLPSLHEIPPESILDAHQANEKLEEMIQSTSLESLSTNAFFVRLFGHVISLEALLNIYVHQIRNEFTVLEGLLPQGYVYTINPPSIFAAEIGRNIPLLNRLQLLALKMHHQKTPLQNLKMIGISDFSDSGIVNLYKAAFPEKADKISSRADLFSNHGCYSVQEEYALVIHNNSDAFGQNIETEGCSSLDGVIGSYSSAAVNLARKRRDLTKNIVKT